MQIVLIAVIAGLVAFLLFYVFDKRKAKAEDQEEEWNEAQQETKKEGKKQKEKKPAFNELGLPFYDEYVMSKLEWGGYSVLAGIVIYIAAFLFYKSYAASLILALGGMYFPKIRKKQIILKRKNNLTNQFKQALASISSSIAAGKSVENAFRASLEDLNMLYPDEKTDIIREIKWIIQKAELNEPIEQALMDFAERANLDDIRSFASVFVTCKRTGGDLVNVVRTTSNMIQDKIEAQNEIRVLLASKKMEQKILIVVPFLLIGYLGFLSGGFMDPMYNTLVGRIVMTFGWVGIFGVWYITEKIMSIKVE